MPYLFCLLVDLAGVVCTGYIAYLVSRGASPWLIVVACFVALNFVLPSSGVFECPNCHERTEFKTYKASLLHKDPQGVIRNEKEGD